MGNYIDSIRKQMQYYKMLGDKIIAQLPEESLFFQPNKESNNVATIVKHITGNMKSRFTDFLTTDGEKEWRNRDGEFECDIKSREEVLSLWEEGWKCVFEAIDSVNKSNIDTVIYIRNQGHTIVEAFNRQLAHYPYHIGQMVFLAKMIKGSEWESLSIPAGASKDYNKEKFSKEKSKTHFTDEYIKK